MFKHDVELYKKDYDICARIILEMIETMKNLRFFYKMRKVASN